MTAPDHAAVRADMARRLAAVLLDASEWPSPSAPADRLMEWWITPEDLAERVMAGFADALVAERDAALADNASLRETIRMHGVWDFPKDIQDLNVRLEAALARAEKAERWRDDAMRRADILDDKVDAALARNRALEEGLQGTLSAMEAMAAGEAARDAPDDLARLWNTAAYHARALLAPAKEEKP